MRQPCRQTGTAAGARNVISSNHGDGVHVGEDNQVPDPTDAPVSGGISTNVIVVGNFIGTDAGGTLALANDGNGVTIWNNIAALSGIFSTPGVSLIGNVISANAGYGVQVYGENNTVQGNRIGTQADGVSPLGNAGSGV